jgi:hypothetical protein
MYKYIWWYLLQQPRYCRYKDTGSNNLKIIVFTFLAQQMWSYISGYIHANDQLIIYNRQ